MKFRTLQKRIVPTGGREIPARLRQNSLRLLFLRARHCRIRLLRVLSHSHREQQSGLVEEGGRVNSSRALDAQTCLTEWIVWNQQRAHFALLPFCHLSIHNLKIEKIRL